MILLCRDLMRISRRLILISGKQIRIGRGILPTQRDFLRINRSFIPANRCLILIGRNILLMRRTFLRADRGIPLPGRRKTPTGPHSSPAL